jgi:hypothetical protein
MPQFLSGDATGSEMEVEQDNPYGAYLEEYRRMGDKFQLAMYFTNFFHLKQKNRPIGSKRTPQKEL